ncbi:tRNA(Met) cytidine acetyltransferase TmcA [Rheinheimera sp. EpRS3]|uniref:tRNA(Met) cytidine acetyltransferase TmcA n=1 Tax=Rheinheimera sp. EpRS3 TaxID=1712383 RepID=UPI0007492015|nr:GNAT family N-acetyltransferase [Rheinheimera sp. EpRS3]KUM51792.1 tRNA(Met) cytidine acetyltransferase [Rheinheimera sp. EpRS3]
MPLTALLAQLQQWQQQAAQLHIRLPVIWQCTAESLLSHTSVLLSTIGYDKLYWLGAEAPADAVNLTGKQNYQLLGSECDVLVINAFSGFNADLVAASAGCVKAGGIWLLLCPPFAKWQQQANPAHKNLLPYPLDAATYQGSFLSFLLAQLQQQNALFINEQHVTKPLSWPAMAQPHQAAAPCVTAEQQDAVEAILHVVSGHRRRPLVLAADRGRGKSAALGIAAAQLAAQGKQLLITAASPQAAATALTHFSQLAPAAQQSNLQFIPFDELLRSTITADLLLVDEAAAIPTPVLQQLVQRFSRIVFATTEHGYEGTGRGFQLRFQQYLNQQCPGWRKLQIQQPIRYQQADPLEQLIFNCFLLRQSSNELTYSANSEISAVRYQAKDWLNNTNKLQQVFSLLSLAHYQTQVKDLAALLDNPRLQVVTLEQDSQVLACVLIISEGDIAPELANQIYLGERRVQGHLLAQSLAFHLAQPELASLSLWRIMRIAVQPALQKQGLGTQLLGLVSQQAKQQNIRYLGTSFGVSTELLQFWQRNGYLSVRLGVSSDKASAEYSILMLSPVNADGEVVQQLNRQFGHNLFLTLSGQYPQLDANLALQLATPLPDTPALTEAELQQLALFCRNQRPYELIEPILQRWFCRHYHALPPELAAPLCSLYWQHSSWPDLLTQYGFNNKNSALALFRQHIAKLIFAAKYNHDS